MILINEQQIRARIPASANVEMSLLKPNIQLYQETRLVEILGWAFYNDIVIKYTNQSLNANEQTLLTTMIHPLIAFGGLKVSIPFLWGQISNRGVIQQSGDFVAPATDSAFRAMRDSITQAVNHYEERLIKYLELNKTQFALWTNSTGNLQQPETQSPNDFGFILDYFDNTSNDCHSSGPSSTTACCPSYYGSFYDTTTQVNAGTTASNLMTFNSTDFVNGVSVLNSTDITMTYAGVYNIQFSAQFDKTDSGIDEVEVWLRKNGVDVPHSTSVFTLNGNNDKVVGVVNYFVNAAAGDYFNLVWHSNDIDLRIFARPVQTNPDRPEVPSIILTVNKVD